MSNSGSWCIPRKGSPAYDQVRALMAEKEAKPAVEESFERPPGPKGRKAPSSALLAIPPGMTIPEFLATGSATDYVPMERRERQRTYISSALFDALKLVNDFYMTPDPHTLGRYVRKAGDTLKVSIPKDIIRSWSAYPRSDKQMTEVMDSVVREIASSKLKNPDVYKLPVVVKV